MQDIDNCFPNDFSADKEEGNQIDGSFPVNEPFLRKPSKMVGTKGESKRNSGT